MPGQDAFDEAVNDALRERPKPVAPPPGMVGTTPARIADSQSHRPKVRLTEPTESAAGAVLIGIGAVTIALGLVLAVVLSAPASDRLALALSSFVGGMLFVAAGIGLGHLHRTAHWTRQTAEAIRQAEEARHQKSSTASKND